MGGRASWLATGGLLVACGAGCLWADDQPAGSAPFIDYTPMCNKACQALGACVAADPTSRPFEQGKCEAYCNEHTVERYPAGHRPLQHSFTVRFYSAYADGEVTCDSSGERMGLSRGVLSKIQSELFVSPFEATCAANVVRDCGVTEAEARDTCFFEVGILDVPELGPCVYAPQTCQSAAMCRRDAARAAGWVEEDKPWLGPSP